jgi:tetratricopeptide (TPR) repeat protein
MEKPVTNSNSIFSDNQRLSRLVLIALGLLVIVTLAFTGYYYWDRYIHVGDVSPLEIGITELEAAVRENPEDPEPRLALAQYYFQSGSYSKSITQAEQILNAFPEENGALFLLGMSHYQSGEFETALEPLEQFAAIRREGQMARTDMTLETALYFLGEGYLRLGQPELAIPVLTEALEINRADADAMFQLGLAYTQTDQHELALEQYQNAVRFVPDFAEAYHGMIASYSALDKPSYVAYARGMEAFALNDFEVAQIHLENAAASLSDFAPAFLGLGLAYEQLGDLAAAREQLLYAQQLDPENFMAENALGRIGLITNED